MGATIRIVRDQTVDSEVNQPRHLGRGVHGPRHDFQAKGLCFFDVFRRDVAPERRPGGTAGRLGQPGQRPALRRVVEPAQPGRRPSAGPLHRIEVGALDGEARGGDLGRQLPGLDQAAPVERLQRAAGLGLGRADVRDGQPCEGGGVEREIGLGRIGLDLDVETNAGCGLREELGQGREALAVDRLLLGVLLAVFAGRVHATDVIALEVVEGQRADGRSGGREPLPVRSARQVGIEQRVVADDDDAVAGHREVGFERRDAEILRHLEPGQRVFGCEPARAAMALQVERRCQPGTSRPDCAGERCDPRYRDGWRGTPASWM